MPSIETFKTLGVEYEISPLIKRLRSAVIREYMTSKGKTHAVCFSSGMALAELKRAGVPTLGVCDGTGDLVAKRWFTKEEIGFYFANCFDATSGHLPFQTMGIIAELLRKEISGVKPGKQYKILSGSGESAYIFSLAFPNAVIVPVFDQRARCTEWNRECEFNRVLSKTFPYMEIINTNGKRTELKID